MADTPIWPGSGSLSEVTNSTPYGFYDSDVTFISHSVQTAEWCATRLGYPIMEVELQGTQLYTCFEEAITEYGAIVNRYNIKENISRLQGAPTSSNFTHTVVSDLGRAISVSETYGQEVGVGGNIDWKTGFVTVNSSSQVYDLNDWAEVSESNAAIEIKRVFHEPTPAMARYFDPYAGVGQNTQNLLDGFGWGDMTPATTFTMMPVHEDLLRVQAIELNDQIRKSAYSFELINNKLRVFPIPTETIKIYFQYIVKADRWKTLTYEVSGSTQDATEGGKASVQSDFSNIRYDNMNYSDINDPGKQWIRKYTLALAKELLGMIRSKYGSVPLPGGGGETTLDGDTLRGEASAEKDALVEQLTTMLEASSDDEIMAEEAAEAESTQEILKKVPLKIYIG
tara:strand:+ start:212 stop:1399 length:1188 start_codon:yes stop_codon:yes gene_type:complete